MSSKSSKTSSQFIFVLFAALTLALGVILTTGKASLNLFSSAYLPSTGYTINNLYCKEEGNETCNLNKGYQCIHHKWTLARDCASVGQRCTQLNPGIVQCVDKTNTYLTCLEDDNIWSCDLDEPGPCKIKEYCGSRGCIQGAFPVKCVSTTATPTPRPTPTRTPTGL